MDNYVSRANIDHYCRILTSHALTARNRYTIVNLMIAEMDKMDAGPEQLQFAEDRAAKSRDRVTHFRKLRDGCANGSTEQLQADKALANIEMIHRLMEDFCCGMREKVGSDWVSSAGFDTGRVRPG